MSTAEPLPDADGARIMWTDGDGTVHMDPAIVAHALESLAAAIRQHGAIGVTATRRDFLRISTAALEIARLTEPN